MFMVVCWDGLFLDTSNGSSGLQDYDRRLHISSCLDHGSYSGTICSLGLNWQLFDRSDGSLLGWLRSVACLCICYLGFCLPKVLFLR